MDPKLASDFHKYQAAMLLYGFQHEEISKTFAGLGSCGKPYSFCTAFLIPKSPKGIMSSLPRWKIRNISAVHLPMPLTLTNSAIISSSAISDRMLKLNSPLKILKDKSFMYCIFLCDSPIFVLKVSSGVEMICFGVGRVYHSDLKICRKLRLRTLMKVAGRLWTLPKTQRNTCVFQ